LDDARGTGNRKLVGEVIGNLVDYTLSHFSFEEELMLESGYAFAGPHKRVHDVFVKRVADFQLRFKAGEDVVNDLHSLLVRWLVGHIKNDDAAYVKTVEAHTHARTQQSSSWISRALGRFFK
jgi:hemerythrin